MSKDVSHTAMANVEAQIQEKREQGRDKWDSPVSFVLAAIGSAVGLGNVWRFPYLVSKFGGAPFLIPYFICLILVGMPILGMELSLGTFYQAGDADAFGSMNPRLRGIGLASVFGGYVITFYYTIILAWACIYFVESFQSTANIPWANDSAAHFNAISMNTAPVAFEGTFNWKVFLATLVVWILIFGCICNGVKSAGWIVKLTVPLPLLILVILIIRGAFFEGASDGIKAYIWNWDASLLNSSTIWTEAIGQVFFSLGVCMGVMTAYSSHNNKGRTNVPLAEKIISLSDTGIALLGGFAVYEMLGFMQVKCERTAGANLTEEALKEVCNYYKLSSMGLAFIAYPEGLASLEAPQFWGILFYGCLIMLGIDSAFSLCETMTTTAKDHWIGLRIRPRKWVVAAIFCTIAFLGGFLYFFDSGLVFLDIVDRYINNWGMVLIGMLECFAVGWVYQIDLQYKAVGRKATLIYDIGFFLTLVITTIIALATGPKNALDLEPALSGNWPGGVAAILFVIGWGISIIVSFLQCDGEAESTGDKLWGLMGWHGPDNLRLMANNAKRDIEREGEWKPNTVESEWQAFYRHDCFSISFGFLIKYFSCILLFVISMQNIKTDVHNRYSNYPSHLLIWGQLIFVFMLTVIVSVAIFPRIMYDPEMSGKEGFMDRLKWAFTPYEADASAVEKIQIKASN